MQHVQKGGIRARAVVCSATAVCHQSLSGFGSGEFKAQGIELSDSDWSSTRGADGAAVDLGC